MKLYTITSVPREPVMADIATVSGAFAIHRASVPGLIRAIGSDPNPVRPFEGVKNVKWLITWASIANVLEVDVATARRDALGPDGVQRLVLSIEETANVLGAGVDLVRKLIETAELYAVKLANEWKIPVYAVANYTDVPAREFLDINDRRSIAVQPTR